MGHIWGTLPCVVYVGRLQSRQLHNFFDATNDLIKVVARACGYDDVSKFNHSDLSTFDREMHYLTGINYAGI